MRGTRCLRQFHGACPSSIQVQKSSPHNLSQFTHRDDIFNCNVAITNHMRNGQVGSALGVFNSMPLRNLFSWNCLLSGHLSNGQFDFARKLFERMPERDIVSWNAMISGAVRNRKLGFARLLFDQMPERNVVSWNALLSGYVRNGFVDAAREIFDRMPTKDSKAWNGVLTAYVMNGRMDDAHQIFGSKEDWEVASWNLMMGGCVKTMRLIDARFLFDKMPQRDVVSWNTMISGYAQNGDLAEARVFFDQSPFRDVFSWTAMVSGYVQNGMLDEARKLFDQMPEKSTVSWNAMVFGYVQCMRMDLAVGLFELMPCRDITSWNTMITGYSLCGDIVQAQTLFDRMPQRDSISWAAMIAAHAQIGSCERALHMFVELKRDGEKVNRSSFTCALSSCADIAVLELGRQLHGLLVKAGFEAGCYVGNALLAMYFKCGSIDEAHHAFEDVAEKDITSWNTMITGYARHGLGKEALRIFESMKATGIRPDDFTMIGVLSACCHPSLVDIGTGYFHSMNHDFGILPNPVHYYCMIDLLGRAGRLDDALDLMKQMPFEPDAASWGAILSASRIHGNSELGEKAAKMIFEMDFENPGMCVLLSNLYAASGKWDDVSKTRIEMRDRGVRKTPGCSWIEVQDKIHTFTARDCVHPDQTRIYALLEGFYSSMKQEGYVYLSEHEILVQDILEAVNIHH